MFFKGTRQQLSFTIKSIRQAFGLLVATVTAARLAVEANTSTVQALAAENKVLREQLAVIADNTSYLKAAKKQELQRSNPTHQI